MVEDLESQHVIKRSLFLIGMIEFLVDLNIGRRETIYVGTSNVLYEIDLFLRSIYKKAYSVFLTCIVAIYLNMVSPSKSFV